MSFEILRMMAQEYADRHKEPQSLPATIDTMAYAYQRICPGEDPWTALGDFSNAWYGYAKHIRPDLIKDPLTRPEQETEQTRHWGLSVLLLSSICVTSFINPARNGRMIPTTSWQSLGGICCAQMIQTHKNTSVQSHHQRLLAAISFAVTDSIKINMKCMNGFRKPSSKA
ncbi:MAG TPA: hypothetical protein VFK47_01005 [Ktedonobacteraceae bacterium]|nr:hypothetical protein [Ktedonobacteraceae bacterium]